MRAPKRKKLIEIHDDPKDKEKKIQGQAENIAASLVKKPQREIHSDVMGSYIGMSIRGEYPTQDADDL